MAATTTATTRYVYRFGNGVAEGTRNMKDLLGGKGANLADMCSMGLRVPAGFTITTKTCGYCSKNNDWPEGLEEEVQAGIQHMEHSSGRRFGDNSRPLLVSVRSGAAQSMPGMMDTVLNLGLNDDAVIGLAKESGNERFAYDAYRRFIDMFSDVVTGIPHRLFEEAMSAVKQEKGTDSDQDLNADDLKELVKRYKDIYHDETGEVFPVEPQEQLRRSIDAVFGSWESARAIKYRRIHNITGLLGTAVNVQMMVYGNMGEQSATGVCFTRNPATGKQGLYGEFLMNAQGEDVVAGIRTAEPISHMEKSMSGLYSELVDVTRRLEARYQNMQDVEFTVQKGTLYILQTRNGKRTGPAALRIAVDMVREGLTDKRTAVQKLVEPTHLNQLLHPRFKTDDSYLRKVIATGLPASPGAAVGQVVFGAEDAEAQKNDGKKVILVRIDTSPEDVGGMDAAEGILTSRGAMTSHAAVVARGWGKPCIVGCGDIVIDYDKKEFSVGNTSIKKGDWISINGTTGEIIQGALELAEGKMCEDFEMFMEWTNEFRKVGVRANADSGVDVEKAVYFGAEGVGLCRTEHMFFEGDRIQAVREMILAGSADERRDALEKINPYQKKDFRAIYRAAAGRPVTVRLLDPPLHEFIPHDLAGQEEVANTMGVSIEKIKAKVSELAEVNPMLGHRGCRLGITCPDITEMQVRAILEAGLDVKAEGVEVQCEIMVPLIGSVKEFLNQKRLIQETADVVFGERGDQLEYSAGAMIELPRAALLADEIASEAEFFSFGTNDLTQMTYGFSRDDAGKFVRSYLEQQILSCDPFQVLDQHGVGQLVRIGTERGRMTRPDLKVGICGEHGGEPSSVRFCCQLGMDYVSCSPFRIPIARLAAAQAQLDAEDAEARSAAV